MDDPDGKGKATLSAEFRIQQTSQETVSVPAIPTGISVPKPLLMEGNMATHWKKFRRGWRNYAVISRLEQFDERFKGERLLAKGRWKCMKECISLLTKTNTS